VTCGLTAKDGATLASRTALFDNPITDVSARAGTSRGRERHRGKQRHAAVERQRSTCRGREREGGHSEEETDRAHAEEEETEDEGLQSLHSVTGKRQQFKPKLFESNGHLDLRQGTGAHAKALPLRTTARAGSSSGAPIANSLQVRSLFG